MWEQYETAIFYHDEDQKKQQALASKAEIERTKTFPAHRDAGAVGLRVLPRRGVSPG